MFITQQFLFINKLLECSIIQLITLEKCHKPNGA